MYETHLIHNFLILGIVFFSSFFLTYLYSKFAIKLGIFATPNFRSLHTQTTPRGAGIVAAIVTLFSMVVTGGVFSSRLFEVFFIGGTLVTIVGLLDDRFELPAKPRLIFQILAAMLICFFLGVPPSLNLGFTSISLDFIGIPLVIFALVWFYNLFNFIDGIDGMALSCVIFVAFTMALITKMQHEKILSSLLLILGVANAGVLCFNWTPAKVFIGETGTSFNSFVFSVIIITSLWKTHPILWIWAILLAYYLTDTTLTTLIRLKKYPTRWYYPHRSHAYQNLARKLGSHLKMIGLVWAINILWLLPLAILAFYLPKFGWLFCLVAYIPLIIFVSCFGPLYQDE